MLTAVTRTAALLATLALTGCGSHAARATTTPTPTATIAGERVATAAPTATPTPATTHREFVKAVSGSCAKANRTADRLQAKFESAMERNSLREAGRLYGQTQKLLVAHVKRISNLQVPAVDRDAMRRYMSAELRIVGYGKRMGASLRANDLAGAQLLVTSFQREQTRRTTAAIDMGAGKCG